MKARFFISLSLLLLFVAWPLLASPWNPVADKVRQSISYLTGPNGSCTAWTINEKRNLVLTAAHCDQPKDMILVNQSPATVVSKDTKKDLLVLEVKGLDKPALRLAARDPEIGDEVASYGYGLGLERPLFRVAHVSDNRTEIPDYTGGNLVSLDSGFVPGQSGGPVVNLTGDVVMIVQGSGEGVGIGVGAEIIREKMGKYFSKEP